MAAETPTQQPDGETLLNEITRHVFLVLLHISWPKLAYQIADAIVQIEGEDSKKKEIAEKFRSKPQWQLMPEEWKKKLGSLENRARALVSSASVQFAARGMAVLPVVRAAEIFAALRTCRTEMEQYRDEFAAAYEKILTDLETELGKELYAKASKKLPDKDDVRAKFGITWAIVPAGGSGADPARLAELRALLDGLADCVRDAAGRRMLGRATAIVEELNSREISQITDQEAEDLVREAREQMHQFTQEMLEDMAREPRQILAEAANNLIEALQDQTRVIRTGTIDQVRRAFQMVEGFSFLAGPDLLDRMARVRERLDAATPQELNSNAAVGAALATALRGVRDAAADAQGASEAMRNFRGIRIRSHETANVEQ